MNRETQRLERYREADSDTAAALLEMGGTCCALLASVPLMTMVLDLLRQML